MTFAYGPAPKCLLEETFTVPAGACGAALRLALPALTDRFQEIAGRHAHEIGCGIQTLREEGITWVLGRLSLRIAALPAWRDAVRLLTWPSGVRGRLAAERQFVLEDAAGRPLVTASSEWLCVNLKTGRLARMPERIGGLANPDTPDFGYCRKRFPAAVPEGPAAEAAFAVRRADIDVNRHVNNVHYTSWMLETLPEELFFHGVPVAFDIAYRRAAKLGDTVVSRTCPDGAGGWHHTVTAPDGTEFARAVSRWKMKPPEA